MPMNNENSISIKVFGVFHKKHAVALICVINSKRQQVTLANENLPFLDAEKTSNSCK